MEENQNQNQNQNKNKEYYTNGFRKSDKYFYKANIIFIVIMAVYAVILCVTALIMMINESVLGGIIALGTGAVTIVIAFIVFKLYLSMLADIKYIRNKLYDNENENYKISDCFER